MYHFGTKSLKEYNTLHIDLQCILDEVINYYDFSIIEGIRTEERQKFLFKDKKTKIDGVTKKSKHQGRKDADGLIVSYAVDIMPYKASTNAFSGKKKDNQRFFFMMGMIKMATQKLLEDGVISHNVRFGLDWDSDDVYTDQNFDDLPHMELVKIKEK